MATRYSRQFYSRSRQPSATALRVETLLSRYPNLREQELAELIDLFPFLPMLDLSLMTADVQLSEKLAAFQRDHDKQLKAPVSSLILFLAFPALVVIGSLWWVLT